MSVARASHIISTCDGPGCREQGTAPDPASGSGPDPQAVPNGWLVADLGGPVVHPRRQFHRVSCLVAWATSLTVEVRKGGWVLTTLGAALEDPGRVQAMADPSPELPPEP